MAEAGRRGHCQGRTCGRDRDREGQCRDRIHLRRLPQANRRQGRWSRTGGSRAGLYRHRRTGIEGPLRTRRGAGARIQVEIRTACHEAFPQDRPPSTPRPRGWAKRPGACRSGGPPVGAGTGSGARIHPGHRSGRAHPAGRRSPGASRCRRSRGRPAPEAKADHRHADEVHPVDSPHPHLQGTARGWVDRPEATRPGRHLHGDPAQVAGAGGRGIPGVQNRTGG